MRRYEVTFVLAPTMSGEEVEQTVENFKKVAEDKGATVVDVDSWGRKRLAFPVKKHSEGYYTVMTLDEPAAQASTELERRFKVTDTVIRFLRVRTDLDLKRAAKMKAERDAKRARRKEARADKAAEEAGTEEPNQEREADGEAPSDNQE